MHSLLSPSLLVPRRAKRVGLGLGLLVLLLGGAFILVHSRPTPSAPPAPRPNIVLITIDTLRADHVGRGLTPAIDALSAGGAHFRNARAAAPLTLPSHVTIMTGLLPPRHGVRQNGVVLKGEVPTLARQLRTAGYQTAAFVGAYVLDRRFGLADGFNTYDDRIPRDPDLGAQLEAERPGRAVADAALHWLGTAQEPFFMWMHLYDPHAPYTPPAEYLAQARGNTYGGEVVYADAQVGRILDALRRRGLDGRAVVAVTGDHGEGLGEHGEETHGMLVYDSTIRVPLVLGGAGIQAATFDRPVSLVDLAGTLLRIGGVQLPQGMSTSSLLTNGRTDGEVYGESEYPRTAGWHPVAALADDRWKLILSSDPELYDLANDPAETRNVAALHGALVDGMTNRVRELATAEAAPPARVDPEAAERLRALGYVSSSSSANLSTSTSPNPARVIADWTAFERALTLVNADQPRQAISTLRTLARKYPASPVFQTTYGRALKDSGDPRAALAVYREAVKRAPADAALFHDLAVAARAAGEFSEAMKAEQAAIALEGTNAAALNGLGLLHAESGRAAEAAAAFERAVAADPTNAAYWTNLGNARRELGQLAGAEAAYRRALDADARYANALNGLGVVLVQQDRAAEAVAWFERALQEAPELHEARLNLGIALQESGQPQRAAHVFRQLLATAPSEFKRERQAASELLKQVR